MIERKRKTTPADILIQSYIDKRDHVTIFRTLGEHKERESGFILAMSKSFLLIQVSGAFTLDGYLIIKREQINTIRCNRYDKTQKKIFKAEGILKNGYGIDRRISLSNWEKIFEDLKNFDYHVIIEGEEMDPPSFEIGPIKKVLKSSVTIHNYDPGGKLDKKPTSRKYSDITSVKFGDNYTTIFSKYLKLGKPIK